MRTHQSSSIRNVSSYERSAPMSHSTERGMGRQDPAAPVDGDDIRIFGLETPTILD